MAAKFKVGDFIRLADIDDPEYTQHRYWRIVKVQKKGYVLRAYCNTHHKYINQKLLKNTRGFDKYKNMLEFIDTYYRLMTPAEKILYVKKTKV